MLIARTIDGKEGAILIHPDGTVVTGTGTGGGGSTSVWSASDAAANGMTLSNGGLTVTGSGSAGWGSIRGTISHTSGKVYVEFSTSVAMTGNIMAGLASSGFTSTVYLGSSNYSVGDRVDQTNLTYESTGFVQVASHAGGSIAANDVIGIAVDFTAQKIWWSHNNTWFNANPSTGTAEQVDFVAATVGALFPALSLGAAGAGVWTLQATAASQKYAPPSGFSAWDGGAAPPPPTSVWSAADAAAGSMTLSNGGLTVVASNSAAWQTVRGTISKTAGKLYVEFAGAAPLSSNVNLFGVASSGIDVTKNIGGSNYSGGPLPGYALNEVSAGFTSNYAPPHIQPHVGDVWALAVDFTAGNIWIAQNNVWLNSSSPATGTLPIISFVPATVGALFPGMSLTVPADGVWTLQATAASQKYAPPSGFVAWDGGVAPPPTSVWSASDAAANAMTLSNGGLTVTQTAGAAYQSVRGTISQTAGKYYVEFLTTIGPNGPSDLEVAFGIASASFVPTNYLGSSTYSSGNFPESNRNLVSTGFTSNYAPPTTMPVTNDVWAIAVDLTAGSIWLAKNNVWFGSGNPATGASPMVSIVSPALGLAYFPAWTGQGSPAGTWTLQSQPSQQKYLPPPGFQAWDGGPVTPSTSSQALAYLARTVGGNEGGNGTNIATLIDGLVADGVWAKLDCLYVLAQQNQTDALLNLVGTSYSLTTSGAPTFTSYVGFNGGGSSYLITGFNPISAISPNYTRDSANFGIWSYANVISTNAAMGAGGASNLYNNYTGNIFYARVNNSFVGSVPTTSTKGLFVGDRPDASNVYPYQNGVSGGALAFSSTSPDNAVFWVGGAPAAQGLSSQTISEAHIGASLGSAGQLALYNRLRTYMTAVGVP